MSSFRFLDVTTAIEFDVNEYLRQLSPDFLDVKGSPKIIYYESGTNFYKNMIAVILSTTTILLINVIVFLLLRVVPFDFTFKLS